MIDLAILPAGMPEIQAAHHTRKGHYQELASAWIRRYGDPAGPKVQKAIRLLEEINGSTGRGPDTNFTIWVTVVTPTTIAVSSMTATPSWTFERHN